MDRFTTPRTAHGRFATLIDGVHSNLGSFATKRGAVRAIRQSCADLDLVEGVDFLIEGQRVPGAAPCAMGAN